MSRRFVDYNFIEDQARLRAAQTESLGSVANINSVMARLNLSPGDANYNKWRNEVIDDLKRPTATLHKTVDTMMKRISLSGSEQAMEIKFAAERIAAFVAEIEEARGWLYNYYQELDDLKHSKKYMPEYDYILSLSRLENKIENAEKARKAAKSKLQKATEKIATRPTEDM